MSAPPSRNGERKREIGAAAAARILDVSRSTIYRYVESGDLRARNAAPKSRQRRALRFDLHEVEALRETQVSES